MYQYSNSVVDFKVSDETGEMTIFNHNELSPFTEVVFTVTEDTFVNNQTVCMTYTDSWQEKYCDTKIDEMRF